MKINSKKLSKYQTLIDVYSTIIGRVANSIYDPTKKKRTRESLSRNLTYFFNEYTKLFINKGNEYPHCKLERLNSILYRLFTSDINSINEDCQISFKILIQLIARKENTSIEYVDIFFSDYSMYGNKYNHALNKTWNEYIKYLNEKGYKLENSDFEIIKVNP